MHIPKTETKFVDILPFEKALMQSSLPNGEYDINKWLYVPPTYGEYRYILGTRGKDPLICIGINPSTASPDHLDNTLKSVERIALGNGYDSFIMFNVYAQRATDPDDMEKECNLLLHKENLLAFEYVLSSVQGTPSIWAAWGSIIEKRDYLFGLVEDFAKLSEKFGAVWYSCGDISKKGHPHHPLYLKKDSKTELFDIEKYCASHKRGE